MQTNITNNFSHTYTPYKALLIYRKSRSEEEDYFGTDDVYVESYDIGKNGRPVNAHPLSARESIALAEVLQSAQETQNRFLKCRGIIPPNLLHVNIDNEGYAVWYTPPMERQLFFVESLGIPPGMAKVPAMVWKAGRDSLNLYAIKGSRKPHVQTPLYYAPYFNMYADAKVCMGSVKIRIDSDTCLEDVMKLWETYFFNSYFSHTIEGGGKTTTNIVQLWQQQSGTGRRLPEAALVNYGKTLEQIIR